MRRGRGKQLVEAIAACAATVAMLLGGATAQAAPDTLSPDFVNLTLRAGESAVVDESLTLRGLPEKADVIIAIDNTGSMSGAIAKAKTEAQLIVERVKAGIPGARFAIVSFRDYPVFPFGCSTDSPYNLLTNGFTPNLVPIRNAISTMFASCGWDLPESYNRVFFEAYSDPVLQASRDPEAAQFLLVLGDSSPHDATQTFAPECGNQPPTDLGRDGRPGTADDLETEAVIPGLREHYIDLLMVIYHTGSPGSLECYEQLAAGSGGEAFQSGGGSNLAETMREAIRTSARSVRDVIPQIEAGCPLSVQFSPTPPYGPVVTPTSLSFSQRITVPRDLARGSYTCALRVLVDGALRATGSITVTVLSPEPKTITLEPAAGTNVVDTEHCVRATPADEGGRPTADILVRFSVTGSSTVEQAARTADNGVATFCYRGPELPGADRIAAFADTNENGTNDAAEPAATAEKTWAIPASTPGCAVTVHGSIVAPSGDKVKFSGNAKVALDGVPTGRLDFKEHGSALGIASDEASIDAVSCSEDGHGAVVYGMAVPENASPLWFKLELRAATEPGGRDTLRLLTATGVDTGEQPLKSGNVEIGH